MNTSIDFRAHLRRQLGFLSRSCEAYDSGHTDEAIRIATVARVLIHQTKTSTSLLTYLDATAISLLSTTRGAPIANPIHFVGLGIMHFSSNGSISYEPKLDRGSYLESMPMDRWWSQLVMAIDRHALTRRSIVLAAANTDGGAHVDSTLTAEYEALAKDGAIGYFQQCTHDSRTELPIVGAHLVSLRQIGYELLHSPELSKLADG